MSYAPKVSVLMSAYNSEEFLTQAIESICRQTFTDFEFLIYDDASTDSTASIIEEYCKKDSRIISIKNLENQGLTCNLADGMKRARGEYVARMDADDIAFSNRLEKQVEYMNSHPDISILGSHYIPFIGNQYGNEVRQPSGHEAIKCELLLQFTLIHPTVMMRKKDLQEKQLNYDASFKYSQDFDLWERCCHELRVDNLNEPLLYLRSDHPGKISTRKKKPQQKCSNIVRTRQLDNLGLNLTNKEKEIFDDFGSDLLDDSLDAIVILDGVLWKIVQANKARNYYDQEILQKRAAELFRWNCISKFSTNYKTGMYYFKSKMKKYDQRSLKEQIILLMFAMKIRR